MAKRRKTTLFEDTFTIATLMPWWAGVVMAIVIYVVLHDLAVEELPTTVPVKVPDMVTAVMIKSVATWAQYIVPIIFLAGALVSAIGRQKRRGLLSDVATSTDGAALRSMSWRDFELLVAEAFRRRGYVVTETGGGGADGGIDLQLTRDGETFLVQCKHWKAYKVSVNIVRELYGVMAAKGAAGGFVVTSGVFTSEARSFAQGCNIELIDGAALKKLVDAVQPPTKTNNISPRPHVMRSAEVVNPACPRCGSAMLTRQAKRGANAGSVFWGCSSYPQCRGVRAID